MGEYNKNKMLVSSIKVSKRKKIKLVQIKDLHSVLSDILKCEGGTNIQKEHFWFVGIDSKDYIVSIDTVAFGNDTTVIVNPIMVFRNAIWHNAFYGIIAHNHPIGTLEPSEEDIESTDRLYQVGSIVNVPVFDHIIINLDSYYSFKENGIMDDIKESIKFLPNYMMKENIEKEKKLVIREALEKGRMEGESIGKEIGLRDGIRKGLEKGVRKGLKQVARNMKMLNIDIQTIVKSTGLSEDIINKL